jgi:hypothetical protein
MGNPLTIKRFGPPNCYDRHPFGTLCELQDGSLYQQMSRDEDNPDWILFTDEEIKRARDCDVSSSLEKRSARDYKSCMQH